MKPTFRFESGVETKHPHFYDAVLASPPSSYTYGPQALELHQGQDEHPLLCREDCEV